MASASGEQPSAVAVVKSSAAASAATKPSATPKPSEEPGSGSSKASAGSSEEDLGSQILKILKTDTTTVDSGAAKIQEITEKRKSLIAEKKKLAQQLRNENRKRQRIRQRSQYLTNEDLVEVLTMRKSKKNAAEAKSMPRPAPAGSGSA